MSRSQGIPPLTYRQILLTALEEDNMVDFSEGHEQISRSHPHRMRLQRRLYRIYSISFLVFIILCNHKLVPFLPNH